MAHRLKPVHQRWCTAFRRSSYFQMSVQFRFLEKDLDVTCD